MAHSRNKSSATPTRTESLRATCLLTKFSGQALVHPIASINAGYQNSPAGASHQARTTLLKAATGERGRLRFRFYLVDTARGSAIREYTVEYTGGRGFNEGFLIVFSFGGLRR